MWNVKKDTNELICRTETRLTGFKKFMVTKGTGAGRDGLGVGIGICPLRDMG